MTGMTRDDKGRLGITRMTRMTGMTGMTRDDWGYWND